MPYKTSKEDLEALFGQYGSVSSVKIVTDRETGRSKGFGFVEMDAEGADKAIEALNDKEFEARRLRVNEAKPRESRPPRD